jgi:hypothetical protein
MSFTNAEKVDIRRFCGYPAYGVGQAGFQGWRFFQAYGLMEFRLNNMATEEEVVIRTTYLTNLNTLETAIVSASSNLDTAKAAVWEHNPNEQRDRENLFASWRRKLCDFLGVPPGPAIAGGGSSMRMVI